MVTTSAPPPYVERKSSIRQLHPASLYHVQCHQPGIPCHAICQVSMPCPWPMPYVCQACLTCKT